ncbi:rep protein [Circoviridae sp.]|nr:rep protein [Circoviridae sp.]
MGKSKQENQYYRYFFTFNNYDEEKLQGTKLWLDGKCKKYIFQEETGKQGTKHLQGSVSFIKKYRWKELKEIHTPYQEIHWEVTKNSKKADEYCCKEDTRTGRVFEFSKKNLFRRTKSKFEDIRPREDILETISKEPDNRTINWFWSDEGGLGKTSTVAYVEHNYNNVCVANGKGADIKNSVISHLEENELDVLFITVPRCAEGYVSYSVIEEIKDGLIYSGKYEGGFANIEHPHVVVISNFPPDTSKLSEDRWNIVEIKK